MQHFKCNIRDIRSGYPHLHHWMRNLYWNVPAFKDTANFLHIKVCQPFEKRVYRHPIDATAVE